MTERLEQFSNERMREYGETGYVYYAALADESNVPPYFFDVSRTFSLDMPKYRDLSPKDIATFLFNTEFASDRQAWVAIKYAEAVSIIKRYNLDSENPPSEADERKLLHAVGFAVMLEEEYALEAEEVREAVEGSFSSPQNQLRIAFLHHQINAGKIH